MGIPVKLDVFEGPLDLLLHLIEKNKVDIYDIPIVMITEQYMEYIQQMEVKDMDVMSEFLVMAATLVKIKSKMLLPAEVNEDGEEEDPRAELVERLLQYKMYKYASIELRDKQVDALKVVYKKPTLPEEVADYKEDVHIEELLSDLTLTRLNDVFLSVMQKQVDKIDPIRSKFGKIEKEEVNLGERMIAIEEYAMAHGTFSFRTLLTLKQGKMMVIVTFLGVLELIKTGKLSVIQEHTFDDIMITYKNQRGTQEKSANQ